MVQCMESNPKYVSQLLMTPPSYISYTDACKLGTGGLWCSGTLRLKPILWQVEWPQDIQGSLVTVTNPHGYITINDIELSGMLLGFIVLESQGVDIQYKHLGTFCDNMSTVVWVYKLLNSKSSVAGFLLRFLSIRMHQAECFSLIPRNIAG